jgi:hypothetical protein
LLDLVERSIPWDKLPCETNLSRKLAEIFDPNVFDHPVRRKEMDPVEAPCRPVDDSSVGQIFGSGAEMQLAYRASGQDFDRIHRLGVSLVDILFALIGWVRAGVGRGPRNRQ